MSNDMDDTHPSLTAFEQVASDPLGYAQRHKEATGRLVIGSFPMHFPGELAHAAGTLPTIIQESEDPITAGHGMVHPFYCGYTRSVVDQAVKEEFGVLDAIMFGDHCVQVLGAADTVRSLLPKAKVHFYQLISSMSDPWSFERARETFVQAREGMEELVGRSIDDADLAASVRTFNHNRQLIRRIYELRREGLCDLTARQLQHVVKSSMVMDKDEHNALMETLVADVEAGEGPRTGGVRVYLSGHFCQAPKPELLDLIEECGGVVVDDDLYHGQRYISTDVSEELEGMDGLAHWYQERNLRVPCPTRVDQNADWEEHLLGQMERARADAMIVLMAKFCEPHMYYYPEIKEAFERRGVPHLLLETEHEMGTFEPMRTRVETFLEIARRQRAGKAVA
ncbi:2-hydroxyacyl-CoA dehydratase family protein [Patulibacter sp. NPDC049589]|uniref:2-hydroxyacyl-CoA dehydratase subunit D n=1 Tax=Patulibacter sp. NPDC049589 TaxID=3154731 RepID=UPI003435938A